MSADPALWRATSGVRDARPAPTAPPAPREPRDTRLRVLQLGPDLSVRGGVSAVEQLICDYLTPYATIRHVPTMVEGSGWARARVFIRAVRILWRALQGVEPMVVHIHFASRGSTLRKMWLAQQVIQARKPLILHAHGAGFDQFHRGLPAPLRRAVNRTLQGAHLVIALSSQWRDFYIRECELAPSQVVVLSNPVKVPARPPERGARDRVQFVHLGRLGERKGGYDLLRAFQELPEGLRARARLVMAGDGDVEGMRRLAEPLGDRVEVRGWIDATQRDRLLAESDVFVLPSYAEGVPMSLLEAMAQGLPAITTPVGGIPDVFTQGVEGCLVRPGDRHQLVQALAHFISDEEARLSAGRRAHERARAHDVLAYARQLAALYQRIGPVVELRSASGESHP